MAKKNKIINVSITLMLIVVVSKIFGAIRETVLAAYFGTTLQVDAFFVAQNIPFVLFAAIGAAISTGAIPLYFQLNKEDPKQGERFSDNLISLGFIVSISVCIILIVFTPPIVKLFAPDMNEDGITLAVSMTRVLSVTIIFTMLSNIFTALLNSKEKYYSSQLAAIPFSVFFIISIVLFSKYFGLWSAVIGVIGGSIIQVLFQCAALHNHFHFKPVLDFKDKNINKLFVLSAPMIIGVTVQQLTGIVDKILASGLAEGSISAISYANRLIGFVYGVFSISLMTILYTKFSKMVAEGKKEDVSNELIRGLIIMFTVIAPISAISMVTSNDIVSVVYGRGAFNSTSVAMTDVAFFYYMLGVFPMSAIDVVNRAFYSLKDSLNPMKVTIFGVAINIIINIVLVKFMGIGGLALGTSLSYWMIFLVLMISIRKHLVLDSKRIKTGFIKIVLATIPTTIIVYVLYHILEVSVLIRLGVCSLAGGIVYILMAVLLNFENIDIFKSFVINVISRKFHKKAT